jgi:tRNA(fMet)-specific endonuclease VapC
MTTAEASASPLYLLDTNILVYTRKGISSVLDQLRKAGKQRLAIPALVAAELAYGVEESARQAHNREQLKELLRQFTVLPWTQQAMWHYARHYHRLRETGRLIGHLDLLIAAQTLSLQAILVTSTTGANSSASTACDWKTGRRLPGDTPCITM